MRPKPKGPEAEAEAEVRGYEAETKSLRPRPKFWPRGQFGLEALTFLTYFADEQKLP